MNHPHPHQLHAIAALWSINAAAAYLAEHRDAVLIRRPQLGPATTRPKTLAQLEQVNTWLRAERADRLSRLGLKPIGQDAPSPLPPGMLGLDTDIRIAVGDVEQLLYQCRPGHPRWQYPGLWTVACGSRWAGRIECISDALADASPAVAVEATAILRPVDERVRAVCGVGPDHWRLPYSPPCPTCTMRMLRVQTAAVHSQLWTVVCTNPACRCIGDGPGTGDGCPCGMTVPAAGARHIWDATSPLAVSAFAGVALTSGRAA